MKLLTFRRWTVLAVAAVLLAIGKAPAAQDAAQAPFAEWLTALIAEARERGFSEDLIARTLVGLEPATRVIDNDRNQAETTSTFTAYMGRRVNPEMVGRGRELHDQHGALLARLEREYGVQRRFLLAIWGLESRYGQVTGDLPLFQSLATLAWDPRRGASFRRQLFDALTIADRGLIEVDAMRASWAGAMGQPQFMPSSYLTFAVDFDGDGRRDIWNSTADTLASIANYLARAGWNDAHTWGREITLDTRARERVEALGARGGRGCAVQRAMSARAPLAEWTRLGVRRADGGPLPAVDISGSVVRSDDRTFLVYNNYDALLSYNCANLYALSVGLLADELR